MLSSCASLLGRRASPLVCALFLLLAAVAFGPRSVVNAQSQDEFLSQAIQLAHAVQIRTRVPSSVILAQAILESSWGRKPIASANNYFGLKAFEKSDGTVTYGQVATGWTWAWTKEWDGTQYIDSRERFRTYASMADSFDDLGRLYSQNARYAAAMEQTDNPREFARQIARAGFATAPDYADRLIQLMDAQNLYQYDLAHDLAEFVDQSDYPTVYPGQSFEIYFEVRNAGLNTWRAEDGYTLRTANDVTLGAAPRQDMADAIPPQQVIRWTLRMVAPTQPGSYRSAWHITHGDQPFGPELYMDVTVVPPPPAPDFGRIVGGLLVLALILGLVAMLLFDVRARARRRI